MIKIEDAEVMGWEHAVHGMRNPLNSWKMSDSYPAVDCGKCGVVDRDGVCRPKEHDCRPYECYAIGKNDLDLMKRLRNAGTDHRKFMRMIAVYADLTAPLYWWKEFDTYKVGTVANSCSTMHKIHAKEFTLDDFSYERLMTSAEKAGTELLDVDEVGTNIFVTPKSLLNITIGCLNNYRKMYLETNDKDWWWQMIQLLPSSYNQKRTVMLNYEVLANMYKSRKNHKLDEWRDFCRWIEALPYSELITG